MNLRKYLFVVLGLIISPFISFAEARSIVSGRVISDNEELIEYADSLSQRYGIFLYDQ